MGGVAFEGLRVSKRSFYIRKISDYKLRGHQKRFESEMIRLAQKKKVSVFTMFRMVTKMGGKSLRLSRKLSLSAVMVQKPLEKSPPFLNDTKNHGNRILICSDEKNFTVDLVFNKQNNRVVTFGNDVSVQRIMLTIKHPASIMMIGVVALNGSIHLRFGLNVTTG